MTVFEMAKQYYPRLWNKERIQILVDAGRLTEEEVKEVLANVDSDIPTK